MTDGARMQPASSRQDGCDCRFDWGPAGTAALAEPGNIVIVVDVLRFTTAVEAAVGAGGRVYPYRWKDESAAVFARSVGAVLADGVDPAGPSLSPLSLARLERGSSVVLPSPNGSTCAASAAGTGATVVAGCLRNAAAVAEWVNRGRRPVSVIAAGERWPDGSLRPCVEDLIGAGAILNLLAGNRSPEATAALGAFTAVADALAEHLCDCTSARELMDRGRPDDVRYALELNVSSAVPVLIEGAFVRASPDLSGP